MFTKSIKNLLTVSSVLIAVMIISFSISIVDAAGALTPETSYALCHDGLDNDDNGSTDMADSACVGFSVDPASLVPETSYALCHDGLDNDDNGSTDMADSACVGFSVDPASLVPETSYALCHDGLDNDDNGSTDMADSACVGFATETATTTTPNTNTNTGGGNGGGSSSGSFYGGFGGGAVLGTSTGSVLGASTDDATSTCVLFKTFMKKGKSNDKAEVKRLQAFLNSNMNAKLPVTGFFGTLTQNSLKKFQAVNKETILAPWVNAGLMKDMTATGYFYKTTQHIVNKMVCPGTIVELPELK